MLSGMCMTLRPVARLNLALLLADKGELEPAERLCRAVEAAQASRGLWRHFHPPPPCLSCMENR
jgi:hypothetical protein